MNGPDTGVLASIMIRLQGDNRDDTVRAFHDLALLLRYMDRDDETQITDFGLTAVAVDATRVSRRLVSDPHVLSVACQSLTMLAKLCRSSHLKGMLAGELECMELLLTASDSYSYNEYANLHEPAVETLYYLTLNHQDNASLFVGLRGVSILIRIMRDPFCLQNATYQIHACGVLHNLARWTETHPQLQSLGGLHVLCDVVRAHPSDPRVLDAAYGALQCLCATRAAATTQGQSP